ncbi:MAG: thioredoxin domain-containing protein [Sulfolobales archaeon]
MLQGYSDHMCGKPNRLVNSKSRYLRLHACDPIDWYEWGEEAFQKAMAENKPIFLSIGYSSCHWCHVMHRESFLDPEVASILNTYFVPIKVDREEMPDVDEIYMTATIAITGSGGWPLTAFLTPDLRVFYAGTYFPRDRLVEILNAIKDLWVGDRDRVLAAAEEIQNAVISYLSAREVNKGININDIFEKAFTEISASFDPVFGGFGFSSKFPMIPYLDLLLRYWFRRGDDTALRMVVRTANSMVRLGLQDHLAGGFFRYTVDRGWRIPHFEKMLYDNAQIARILVDLYRATGSLEYIVTARKTADFMFENMLGREGLFYSSLDAEAGGVEGGAYLWSEEELIEALGKDMAEIAKNIYGWSQSTLIHERMHPVRAMSPMDLARFLKKPYDEALRIYSEIEAKLYEYRLSRKPKPHIDEKHLADWNSLAIMALARLYLVTWDQRYLDAARKAADVIKSKMWIGDRVAHVYYEGEASKWGYLSDTSLYGSACVDLYMATNDEKYLEIAVEISQSIEKVFIKDGVIIENPDAPGSRSIAISTFVDNVIPSGASATIDLYSKLYLYSGDNSYREKALEIFRRSSRYIDQVPQQYAAMITYIDTIANPSYQVAVTLVSEDQGYELFIKNLWKRYWVGVTSASAPNPRSKVLRELYRGKVWGEKPVYYICYGTICALPTQDPEEALRRFDDVKSQNIR